MRTNPLEDTARQGLGSSYLEDKNRAEDQRNYLRGLSGGRRLAAAAVLLLIIALALKLLL